MLAKEESLLETINKLKSDIDKGKEKSSQQKTQIRDLQQVYSILFYIGPCEIICDVMSRIL